MIDTHCHLNDPQFDGIVDQMVSNFLQAGVNAAICIGCEIETSRQAVDIAEKFDSVYATVGVHPDDCDKYDQAKLENLILSSDKVLAVGEIGLDYYHTKENKEQQKQVFISQVKLAKKYNLPIVVHCRDAYKDTLEILTQYASFENGVVMHCYSGSIEFARQLLKLGVKFSFTGVVTYKNAANVQEVVKNLPLESFFFETDCPYLSPVPKRGQRNEPQNVIHTLKFVADLRNMDYKELEAITDENAKKFFKCNF